MKKSCLWLAIAMLLAGCAAAPMYPAPGPVYTAPAQYPFSAPWVGTNTPWVFYNGDWFLNGMLFYNFGPRYGWAPYYAYPSIYIVRPANWYAPRWNTWYQAHPNYRNNFVGRYPYWRSHRYGQRYDQNFYNKYHRNQGSGWHKGFHGASYKRTQPPKPPRGAVQGTRPDRRALGTAGHSTHSDRRALSTAGHGTRPERRALGSSRGVQPDKRRSGSTDRKIVPGRKPGTADRTVKKVQRPAPTTSPKVRKPGKRRTDKAPSGQTRQKRKESPTRKPQE
jgi:hypothetical protein